MARIMLDLLVQLPLHGQLRELTQNHPADAWPFESQTCT